MGKGQIVSGGTDGQYNVKLTLHREHLLKKIAELGVQIATLETRISGMDEGPAKDAVIFQKNTLVKSKEYYENNMPDDPTIEAWCADLTEDLTGEVGTIEIPGERGTINIQPGYEGNAAFNSDRDGQLQPAIASKSAAAVFYNLAMLPGWQKWMPNFRYGTITFIDSINNTCNVNLDPAPSFQHDLNINYVSKLIDLPIEYMSCNSAAFEVGDEVIVQFTSVNTQTDENWATGKVIGFKDNPKTCGFEIKLTRGDGAEIGGTFYGFTVKDSKGSEVSISSPVYNVETKTWSFRITSGFDPLGYFVSYDCVHGISTQYPYRYKSADKGQAADLIKPRGALEDTIPYWFVPVDHQSGTLAHIDDVSSTSIVVHSSVPYQLTHNLTAEENDPCYIRYLVRTVPGLAADGGRCCQILSYGYCADVNGPDPAVRMPGHASTLPNGGWGNSLLILDVVSTLITYQEKTPTRLTALDIHEIEVLPANIEGVSRVMTITNNTPSDALFRLWECSSLCPYTTDNMERYAWLVNNLAISFRAEYDF